MQNISNAVSQQIATRASGIGVGFKNYQKQPQWLPQTIKFFTPVSDRILQSDLVKKIEFGKSYVFNNAIDVRNLLGINPAFYISRILKPMSGGGVPIPFEIVPVQEQKAFPAMWEMDIAGSNKQNVMYTLAFNGRKSIDGLTSEFTISNKLSHNANLLNIKDAINSNINAPVTADIIQKPATGRKIIIDLSDHDKIDRIMAVTNGGMSINVDGTSYNLTGLQSGSSPATFTTPDLSANIAAILAGGKFTVATTNRAATDIEIPTGATKSIIKTKNLINNFGNFINTLGSFTLTTGANHEIVINTESTAPKICIPVNSALLTKLKGLTTTAGYGINQSGLDAIVYSNPDLSAVNNISDLAAALNNDLVGKNVGGMWHTKGQVLYYETTSKGASISLSLVNGLTSKSLIGTDGFDISNKGKIFIGLNTINPDNMINGLKERIDWNIYTKGIGDATISTVDNELLFTSTSANLNITSGTTGMDFASDKYLNVAKSFKYIGVSTLSGSDASDTAGALANITAYLNAEMVKNDLGTVAFDAVNNALIFESVATGDAATMALNAPTSGTDLTAASAFNTAAGTAVDGKTGVNDIEAFINQISNEATTKAIPVNIYYLDHKMVIENINVTGENSALDIGLVAGNSQQLSNSQYFNIANSDVIIGKNNYENLKLVSKWSGVTANQIKISVLTNQLNDSIVKFNIVKTQDATSTIDLSNELVDLKQHHTPVIINIYGNDKFDMYSDFNGQPDPNGGSGLWDALIMKPIIVLTGTSESNINNLVKIGQSRGQDLTNILCTAPNSPSTDFEIAANYARLACEVFTDNPQSTITGQYLPDLIAPDNENIGAMQSIENRNILFNNGISTVSFNRTDNGYKIQDCVTFRHLEQHANVARDYNYIETLVKLMNINKIFVDINENEFHDKTITEDRKTIIENSITIDDVETRVKQALDMLYTNGLITNIETIKESVTAQISPINASRINYTFDDILTSIVRVISATHYFGFNYGGNE